MDIDYLCVGHCCHDKEDNINHLGGTVSFAAIASKALMRSPAILTSVGDDFEYFDFFKKKGIPLYNDLANKTTVFTNIYNGEKRQQTILAVANKIDPTYPDNLSKRETIIHLGPIADEIDIGEIELPSKSLVGLSIQGLLRKWDENGQITTKGIDVSVLKKIDVLFLSDEDIEGAETILEDILVHCQHLVITHGSLGATIYYNKVKLFLPSWPCKIVDPTGAGDVFATGYLVEFQKTKNVTKACILAHCLASFIVETGAMEAIPTLNILHERISAYIKLYPEILATLDLK